MPNTTNTVSGVVRAVSGITPFMRWDNWPILLLCLVSLIIGVSIKLLRKGTSTRENKES